MRHKKTILLLSALLIGGCTAIVLPMLRDAREAARRTSCKCFLKQLGLSLHSYHDDYGSFPPAYVTGSDGRPWHSWRVLLLPYMDQMDLYKQYSFSEPWDGPNNIKLLMCRPPGYACPSYDEPVSVTRSIVGSIGLFACTSTVAQPGVTTSYAGVFGPGCVFRGSEPVSTKDITDGTSNTFLVGEVTDANIPWTKPEDVDITKFPQLGDQRGFSSKHNRGVQFLLADGSAKFVSLNVAQSTLDILYTIADGKTVPDY